MNNSLISVQCAYKQNDRVKLLSAEFTPDTSIGEGFEFFCKELGLDHKAVTLQGFSVAVFGKKRPLDAVLREGDRIEICGPLIATPMLARRLRAKREHKGGKM